MKMLLRVVLSSMLAFAAVASALAADNRAPPGFTALFNGKDLTGWKGLLKEPFDNPARRAKLTARRGSRTAKRGRRGDAQGMAGGKRHVDLQRPRPQLIAKDYGDFEIYVNWKIEPHGDSGIYLAGLTAGTDLGSLHQADYVRQRSRLRRALQ